MSNTVIVSAKRTAIGSFCGQFSNVSAPHLASTVIQSLLHETSLDPALIQDVILGQVLSAGCGQSPARQALRYAGLPDTVQALTINKVCGSGLKAVMLADQAIRAQDSQILIAGGMENMSQAPLASSALRQGYRLGQVTFEDLLVKDGLLDPYSLRHMGVIAEVCAQKYNITREAQDAYAQLSYERAQKAVQSGRFIQEIAPVEVTNRKKEKTYIATDEEPFKGEIAKLPHLKPAFISEGTITAGNASTINDGSAGVLVMSEDKAKSLNLKPLVRIVASAEISQDPEWFTTAPAVAIKKALQKAHLSVKDIDLWEVNEAFSVVSLYTAEACEIPIEKCNVNGGAIALGHPLGASGARVLVTLIHELHKQTQARYGLASLCIGGGEAVAVIVEKV